MALRRDFDEFLWSASQRSWPWLPAPCRRCEEELAMRDAPRFHGVAQERCSLGDESRLLGLEGSVEGARAVEGPHGA